MKIQYLEIVTTEVDALCSQYAAIYNTEFSEPNASFGGARTAELGDGGMIGIRGPLRESEAPVVRPYVLVEDINAAVEAAKEAGAEVAMPPMAIPGQGMFAIVINGGIDCGFWQN
ncbi:MAG: hydroxylase [Planctomycetota bacterium]